MYLVSLFVTCIFLLFHSAHGAVVCEPSYCPLTYDGYPTAKSNSKYAYTIGYIAAADVDPSYLQMARWRFYSFNNNMSMLPDTRLELYSVIVDSMASTVGAVVNMIVHRGVRVFLVDLSEAATQLVADVATAYGIPVLSISSTTNVMESKEEFGNLFARLAIPDNNECIAMLQMIARMNITAVTYVFSQNVYGLNAGTYCLMQGQKLNITVTPVPTNGYDSVSVVRDSLMTSKVIFIDTDFSEGAPLLNAINDLGACGPEYFYIFSLDLAISTGINGNRENKVSDGSVIMVPEFSRDDHPTYVDANKGWMSSNATMFPGDRPSLMGWPTLDAASLYANALDYFVKQGIAAVNVTGAMLHQHILSTPQESCAGVFSFENGDRPGSFYLYNSLIGGHENVYDGFVAYYDISSKYMKFYDNPITFSNGSTVNPFFVQRFYEKCSFSICNYRGNCSSSAQCICEAGFTGTHCERKDSNKLGRELTPKITAPIAVVLVAVVATAWFIVHRRRRDIAREVKDKQRSDITRGELKLTDRIGRGAAGEVMKGMFRGTEVAVKRLLTQNASKSLIEEFSLEVAIMCGLRHPNIIMFMGSCYDQASNEMLLVMELMTRGSLHDVLHNPKAQLPFDLQLHLALQAAQGMNFLHSSKPPILHCDLKSHNILLDDKWTARISDFGITRFKEETKDKNQVSSMASLGTIFWTAPEVLEGHAHSEKSDCYAYGVVLWELFHRAEPYEGMDVMQVAVEVGRGRRPDISLSCPLEMQKLIKECWHQDPKQRPSFQQIVDSLRQQSQSNPVQDLGHLSVGRVQAPVGKVYLVKTLIPTVMTMIDYAPRAATKAVTQHNKHLRTTIESYGGYEVKSVGPLFLVAFSDLKSAVDWCVSTQISLLHVAWDPEVLEMPASSKHIGPNGEIVWNGPRVRMVIHSGTAQTDKDSLGRLIYKGPIPERVEKMVFESAAAGVFVSSTVHDEMSERKIHFAEPIISPCEVVRFGSTTSYQVLPQKLMNRKAPGGIEAPGLTLNTPEHAITSFERMDSTYFVTTAWFVNWSELSILENIGRGAIGDFHRAMLRGKEVAVKFLVNQKLKEEDLANLTADAAILSKINHPNLLSFIGACFEEHHISIIVNYVSGRNLREILSDSSTSLSMVQCLKIAREIAAGMAYLASHPDPEVRIHDNLKSHNVMISKNWEVKITDFGQSNIKDLARTMTSVSNVAWTAPEVLEGEDIMPESSLYSYGIILWEILTRKVPYENDHPIKVVTKILAGHRPHIPKEKIPHQCTTILEGCWNRQLNMRPSWHVIQAELTAAIEDL